MNWSNVRLIFWREVRDQLRDRRTLFMIFVLPILLYPLLGTSIFQVTQFTREQATRVLLLGADQLPEHPPLVEDGHFAGRLFRDPQRARLLELDIPADSAALESKDVAAAIADPREAVRKGRYEAVVVFPPDFREQLAKYRLALRAAADAHGGVVSDEMAGLEPPEPMIYFSTAKEKSQLTYNRILDILRSWRDEIAPAQPFDVQSVDAADAGHRDAALWSKVFPFLLLVWALTGAFYPAIDLCAGEKERGTLETLLSSPAERSEIVWGKLLTVMLFSVTTVVFNIASMAITGYLVLSQLPNFGTPSILSMLWLLTALIPISALFSALCLALAAFARSSKEGQYYLMPLLLVTMPLVVLPMAPGVELTLGNSLIPLTGVMLLLRAMMEGDYMAALPFVLPVAGVTLACCLLAIRWAVDQFNSEQVLFRSTETSNLSLWFKHLLRDRGDTPSPSEAVFCGVLILLVRFFMGFALRRPESFADLAQLAAVTQLVVVATPSLLMTIMLTRSPMKTLLLIKPKWLTLPAAVLLAVSLHPLVNLLQAAVVHLYPLSPVVAAELKQMFDFSGSVWAALLVIAVLPACCEELAFRGFMLSGFRHTGHKWRAIVLSSVFFGLTHAVFQQSVVATLVGIVIGYLAVQTGSLFPAVLFHMTHNAMALLPAQLTTEMFQRQPLYRLIFQEPASGDVVYRWPVILVALAASGALLWWFSKLSHQKTEEESLQDAIYEQDQPRAQSLVG